MKHDNLIPSTSMNGTVNAVTRVVPSGKAVLAPFAALLITAFALGTTGCGKSKNNNQSATQSQPVPQSVSNQNLAETMPSTIPLAVNQPETGKKSVKGPVKRASVRTFKDADAGVSFLYPRKAVLKAGEKAEKDSTSQDRLPMSYIGPGGLAIASVELPSKKDEIGNLFLLNVNEELTADQCSQFPTDSQIGSEESSPDGSGNQQPISTTGLKTSFRGVEYSQLDKQNDQSVIRYYHRFVPGASADKGVCYEFGMLVNAEPKQDGDAASQSEHKDVFTKLERILATVKIESKKENAVVETAEAESNRKKESVETAKTESATGTDSSVKADDHTAETAKAIVKDENPR